MQLSPARDTINAATQTASFEVNGEHLSLPSCLRFFFFFLRKNLCELFARTEHSPFILCGASNPHDSAPHPFSKDQLVARFCQLMLFQHFAACLAHMLAESVSADINWQLKAACSFNALKQVLLLLSFFSQKYRYFLPLLWL